MYRAAKRSLEMAELKHEILKTDEMAMVVDGVWK